MRLLLRETGAWDGLYFEVPCQEMVICVILWWS